MAVILPPVRSKGRKYHPPSDKIGRQIMSSSAPLRTGDTAISEDIVAWNKRVDEARKRKNEIDCKEQ